MINRPSCWSYEVILKELGENLVARGFRTGSAGISAQERSRRHPDGRLHAGTRRVRTRRDDPRTSALPEDCDDLHLGRFRSAISIVSRYEMGAVDYVPVPVIPEVLRAKIRVFAELYRKTRQLERLNAELEHRVRARTSELEESTTRLVESEQRRSMANRRRKDGILGLGLGQTATGCGMRASTRYARRRPAAFSGDVEEYPKPASSRGHSATAPGIRPLRKGRKIV